MLGRLCSSTILVALVPLPSHAATVCVNPADPACAPSIQAGVNAAAAGDTVAVAPGLYFENVVVPPGKDGLRIVGAGRLATVIDPDAPRRASAVRIESSGVEVRDLGVRNGQEHGIAIGPGLQGVVLRLLRIVAVRGPSAIFAGPGSTGLQILSNQVQAARVGIHLSQGNDGSLLVANVLTQVGSGILASGRNLQLRANSVAGATEFAVRVTGDTALVADSVLEDVSQQGLTVTGLNPVVRGNRLANAGPATLTCTPCFGGLVAGNSSASSVGPFGLGQGFRVIADGVGLVVRDNQVTRGTAAAFVFEGEPAEVTGNSATDTGTAVFGDGFLLRGPANLRGNTATRTGASGFRVEAGSSLLEANVSSGSGLSGFFVTTRQGGDNINTVLQDNQATGANAAGFSLLFTRLARLRGNAASGNRYDLCDQAIDTELTGNRFTTVSSRCDVVR